ncbi:type II toxin-antitoxin system RelE/ParE family toxin [Streptomyces sp. NPDC127068]|uniref:type II toxin-antitoxin system RelE family toxin n=1 Tax=Streptomyces sp. NPDC127068 TaxID=3347127 RepID=UPI00364FF21F
MSMRVAYTPAADAELRSLPPERRKDFDRGMHALARSPYGCGSSPIRGERDRRDATIANIAFITYIVSEAVVTVTVVKAVRFP